MKLNTKLVSSLEKCFLDSTLDEFDAIKSEAIFKNQKFSFQLAYQCCPTERLLIYPEIESDISDYISIREVVNIPSDMPTYSHSDKDVLRTEPGLFPDLLRPLKYDNYTRPPVSNAVKAFWFTVSPDSKITGVHKITVRIKRHSSNEILSEDVLTLDIKDIELPPQKLIFGQWFYADCLADYYNVPAFSDRHFEICESFIKTAVAGGRNMLLLPLLTYSLDIRHDHYRTNVQLVDIYKDGSNYTYGYEKLDRWLEMCKRNGIEYYEVCHLFSQWGATATPLVMAYENGEYKRIFGWDTDPLSDEYKTFLRSFLKAFIEHMKERGEDQKCWFHVSDEPIEEHLPQYKAVKEIVADIIEGYHHLDALSHYEFYEQGLVDSPVPSVMAVKTFIEHKVPDLWCYYCGGHAVGVSNCHFAMSLSRTRSIGMQMYKYNIRGFLNWGYNFYNNQWSYDTVDPFLSSSGETFSASGDTYMVYPAPNGTAWESNRFVAFYEALEDMRAFELCASLYSKDEVIKAIEDIAGTIEFDKCVLHSSKMLEIRHKIDSMIFERVGK